MKEILPDGNSYVNDDGDIVPIDRPTWEPVAFEPDHHVEGRDETITADSGNGLPIQMPEYRGASVGLRERAVAIEAIMNYFNQANKRSGLSKSRGYNGFDGRYGLEADEVAGNMSAKENRLHAEFMRSVEVLLARDGMLDAGFSPQEVDTGRQQLKRDLYREYGPGRAKADKRAKLKRKVKKTVRVVLDGKSR